MIAVPKLVVLLLVGVAVWYMLRWLNRAAAQRVVRRGAAAAAPQRQAAVEDLTACRACGAYVAAGARACGKPGCPLPG